MSLTRVLSAAGASWAWAAVDRTRARPMPAARWREAGKGKTGHGQLTRTAGKRGGKGGSGRHGAVRVSRRAGGPAPAPGPEGQRGRRAFVHPAQGAHGFQHGLVGVGVAAAAGQLDPAQFPAGAEPDVQGQLEGQRAQAFVAGDGLLQHVAQVAAVGGVAGAAGADPAHAAAAAGLDAEIVGAGLGVGVHGHRVGGVRGGRLLGRLGHVLQRLGLGHDLLRFHFRLGFGLGFGRRRGRRRQGQHRHGGHRPAGAGRVLEQQVADQAHQQRGQQQRPEQGRPARAQAAAGTGVGRSHGLTPAPCR